MVVPIFGTWGRLEDNVLLASTVTVVTQCREFEAQCGLISNCFADNLLVLHGHMCKFLSVGEEFIFMRIFLIQ